MNDLVHIKDGLITVTSIEIAETFGKSHRHVLRTIGNLECSDEFRESNFGLTSYLTAQNKKHKCYDITRDGFTFVAMGFTGKSASAWKERYINAFNAMEKSLKDSPSFMQKINEAIKIMGDDKEVASTCAQGLNKWKRLKKDHEKEVKKLIDQAQLVLSLSA